MKLNSILITFLLTAFILLFSTFYTFAQNAEADSAFYRKALVNSMAVYHQSFGYQSALYNGSKYGEYLFRFQEGFPFFYSEKPVAGSVIYDGTKYDSVLMRYNEVSDVLVISGQSDWIKLLDEKVSWFNLYNSDFIRLVKDSLSNNLVSSGFYNVLYNGKTGLFKKQIKTIREAISTSLELQRFADTKDHYYLKKDNRYYLIKSRKGFFNLFGEQKKEVQQFIRVNKLSFRKDKQNMLTKATAYYDSLKK